ncbi:carcinoembryonic antigen-related cell adhesion molecule 2-like isoform X6 [Cuculus canorus]|uniref:carcinoembryonic antigen-related cell adhesion molecule 2-like isoform X6 n=1 Tax=Cuculus canorus TaxID=55661 RepID=UPI0023AB3012|nr:carcinoembryonic antigen-related cell adhesion molecule 2-like isoform X6 [Cuculus canorus]
MGPQSRALSPPSADTRTKSPSLHIWIHGSGWSPGQCPTPQALHLDSGRPSGQCLPLPPSLHIWMQSWSKPLSTSARTLSPCYSANLSPASERLVSAVGCTVLLTVPPLNATKAVFWEYKTGSQEGVIISYAFNRPANASRFYENRTKFNETDFSLQMVLQRGDDRLYRFRSGSDATGWFQLRVVELLSEPEIVGNSLVKAGGNIKLVCNVLGGKADLYRWKKNGELLLGSNHIQFVDNTTTLCIMKASMNDSGYYTCVVHNEVSQNETSFLLHVQNAANVVLPMILACVFVGLLAGALLENLCTLVL